MNRVVVRLADLREAAGRLGPRRVPAGFRGSIPRTTEIKPNPNGVSVERPYVETAVQAHGSWDSVVSVDCRRLRDTLLLLKKQWKDVGGIDAKVNLSSTVTTLDISWSDGSSTRRMSLPAWPPRN